MENEESVSTNLEQTSESDSTLAGKASGIGRVWFIIIFLVSFFVLGVASARVPGFAGLGSLLVSHLIVVAISYLRLKNIGKSPWLCLFLLIPGGVLILVAMGMVMPEGYHQSKELDLPGKIIGGMLLLGAVFLFIAWFS